jgi:TPR repeat protein
MGEVHLAVHLPTGSRRAVKTLQTGDVEYALRFQREGEAMARLDGHPHVVRIHDSGRVNTTFYLGLELMAGGSLAERLRGGPLPARDAAALVRDLAEGLAHAHAYGILHRDLKPGNVLFDESGNAKLTDFGLAKIVGLKSLTATGAMLGTPAYMAPEQINDAASADERADVYGLGAVLYACLTGAPPFRGTSAIMVMKTVLEQPPTSPRGLAPNVPRDLEAICLRALAKTPAARPESATALAESLTAWLETSESGERSVLPLAIGAVLIGVVLALAVYSYPRSKAPLPMPSPNRFVEPGETPVKPPVKHPWPLDTWNASGQFTPEHVTASHWIDMEARSADGERTLRAFATLGHPDSQRELALTLLKDQPRLAFELLRAALSQGHREAATDFAMAHMDLAELPPQTGLLVASHDALFKAGFVRRDPQLAVTFAKLGAAGTGRMGKLARALLESLGAGPSTRNEGRLWERARRGLLSPGSSPLDAWRATLAARCAKDEAARPVEPVAPTIEDGKGYGPRRLRLEGQERRAFSELFARRGHPSALRHMGEYCMGVYDNRPPRPGRALQYFTQSLLAGEVRAARQLVRAYTPKEPGQSIFWGIGEDLGVTPNLKLAVALLVLEGSVGKLQGPSAVAFEKMVNALGSRPSVPDAWRQVRAALALTAEEAALDRLIENNSGQAIRAALSESEVSALELEVKATNTEGVTRLGHTFAEERALGWEPRAIYCWLTASRAGDPDASFQLARLACRWGLSVLTPAPRAGYRRIRELARGEGWGAALELVRMFAGHDANWAFEPDPALAGAWVRIAQELAKTGEQRTLLQQERQGLKVPATRAEAWRIVRTRKVVVRD